MKAKKTARLLLPIAFVTGMMATPAMAQDVTIATSLPSLAFPFFLHMQNQLTAQAEEIGGVTVVATDGQDSTSQQIADLEASTILGVDGMIITPRDSVATAPGVQAVVDAGIPVITIDRRADGVNGILAHIGADNVLGGEAQAHAIIAKFPDGATIVNLQGEPGASPALDRNLGLHNILDTMADKYTFVSEQTAHWKREEGASVTEAILAGLGTTPDVIVAANDDMALGAAQVAEEQGLTIAILGFDALPEALAAVRDGKLMATIDQLPGAQSRTAMNAMVDFLRTGTKPESLVLLTPIAITAGNLEDAERLDELN